jgi:hypothetical protein
VTDRPVDDGAPREDLDAAVSDLTVDPDTADLGPEATDEQSAFVSGLLGTLRADDPPMPDDVVRRLDAVLAQERLTRLEAAGVTSLPVAAAAEASDEGATAATATAPVTVLPDRAERRGPGMRSFKVLGGVAAAVALVAVGAVIGTSGLGGSSGSSGGSSTVVAAAGVPVADTATTYSKTGLEQQARDLVGSVRTQAYSVVTPEPAPPESAPTDAGAPESPTSASSAPADDGVVTGQELAGCVAELTGRTDVTPIVVDQGTYAGRPAEVLVLPTDGEAGSVDVWVVVAGCRQGSVELLDFRRLALPVTASPSS